MRELKFNKEGTFKIVQFTDVHWNDGCDKDMLTRKVMDLVLKEEKPDLVVFTGDLIYSDKNEDYLNDVLKSVNEFGVPWATVFGNHDDEFGFDRLDMIEMKQKYDLCLNDSKNIKEKNLFDYYLNIKSSISDKPAYTLYLMDSGNYNANEIVGGYGYFSRKQINWYIETSENIRKNNGEIPALAFFHIPLQEYNDVWNYMVCYGEKRENVCCPRQNSGMFSAMVEMGEIKGVFVGHDHVNDYYGELHGIKLCYGRATGYNTYSHDGFKKGARIIVLKEGQRDFDTWVRLEDNSVIKNPSMHKPEMKIE